MIVGGAAASLLTLLASLAHGEGAGSPAGAAAAAAEPTTPRPQSPPALDCLFGVNVHTYTGLFDNLSAPLRDHLGTGVTSLYGLGHGTGQHGATPVGSVDFIDHPTQLFQPNTSYWQDAWANTLKTAPGYMAAYVMAELKADPNPNTNHTTHPPSSSGVLMLDYEPAYRPSWKFQTSSRPDKRWEAMVSAVHTPTLDKNWTELVGFTGAPAGADSWADLSAQQQEELLGTSYDYFCRAYLSAGMKAVRAAIPPAMKLSVWNWPFKFGGSTAANATALKEFEGMVAEMDWLWKLLDLLLPDLYPEFFVGEAKDLPAVLSRCTLGNQSYADLYFSANIAHMQRIRERCNPDAKIYLSIWWHYMCAQKVLDSDQLDYYAQDANVLEPFEQTGHDGVIMWGTVGTFGYEDHDPGFVAKYLNKFWSSPVEKHCAKATVTPIAPPVPDEPPNTQSLSSSFEVLLAKAATVDETFAAKELSEMLSNVTGTAVPIVDTKGSGSGTLTLAVGYDAATAVGLPPAALTGLGNESWVVTSNTSGLAADSIAISGGKNARRGTIYGVYGLLKSWGYTFFAPTETVMPSATALAAVAALPINLTFTPAMEFRTMETFETNGGGDPSHIWALRSHNDDCIGQPAGGCMMYAEPPGSVHTSYGLLGATDQRKPPPDLFKTHPEWFWPRGDPSTYGQLCWSNASLVSFIQTKVKGFLRSQPDANIVSVSQNDNHNVCNSSAERKIMDEEGSPMGPLLRAVNSVADAIADEFPHVVVDTLAYQYTRPAPSITIPRKNVVIRLCSIECNFAAPLTDPTNAPFQKDMNAWAAISNRTYIWDYVTNFAAYVQPFPNYYVLGPNIRYYLAHGVRGMYEEGNGHGPGSDLDAMKAFLMAEIMYDPSQDDDALITKFLNAYYGEEVAPFVRLYMDTMHGSIADTNYYMHESFDHTAAFLTPIALLTSAEALQHAVELTTAGSKYRERVEVAKLAVYYPILLRWDEMRGFATNSSLDWPIEPTKDAALDWFVTLGSGLTPPLTHLNEGGTHDLAWFKKQVGALGDAGAWG